MRLIYLFIILIIFLVSCEKKSEERENAVISKGGVVVDVNGKPISLPKDKLIILNFMAYSCSACMKEIPVLKKILKEPEFKNKFVLIGMVIDSKKNDFSDPEFPKYANNNVNFIKFPVPGTPTTYIITPEGKKLIYILGAVTEDSLRKYLRKAMLKYKGAKSPT
ncbi:MAG: TlpA family protein disulfide reductase [Aquificota bacterium]|nr:MAG: TlpA family protein disulfide reductase [Aquificota bacterium]